MIRPEPPATGNGDRAVSDTIDVGNVHTFTDDSRTTHRPDCPHPRCILRRAEQSRERLIEQIPLPDDWQQAERRLKLGEAVEKLRAAMKNDTGIVDPGYRICLDAIYRAAGVTPEDGR